MSQCALLLLLVLVLFLFSFSSSLFFSSSTKGIRREIILQNYRPHSHVRCHHGNPTDHVGTITKKTKGNCFLMNHTINRDNRPRSFFLTQAKPQFLQLNTLFGSEKLAFLPEIIPSSLHPFIHWHSMSQPIK